MLIGLELELPDIKTDLTIPSSIGVYNYKDSTIVNSYGIANDPLKKDVLIGSEINMTPVDTVQKMLDNLERLYEIVQPAPLNYSSNLHVHISIPGLAQNFQSLQKLNKYTFAHAREVYAKVDPFPVIKNDLLYAERLKRLKHSHHYEFPESRKASILASQSWEAIRDGQQPLKDGVRLRHAIRRCGINIRSLWDHGTVEFRHFFGTHDPEEYRSAIEWSILYLTNAIGDQKPVDDLLGSAKWRFPKMGYWDANLFRGWQTTNYLKNTRETVRKRLHALMVLGLVPEEVLGPAVIKCKE